MKWRKSEWFINYSPVFSTILLEYANFGQIVEMWTEKTAEGQSLLSWLAVNLALWLWLNFYMVATPQRKWAIRCQMLGIALNLIVVFSVVYFKHVR